MATFMTKNLGVDIGIAQMEQADYRETPICERDIVGLCHFLREFEVGEDVIIHFHYGTQREDLDGGGFDNDQWLIYLNHCEKPIYLGRGEFLGGACQKAVEKLQSMTDDERDYWAR